MILKILKGVVKQFAPNAVSHKEWIFVMSNLGQDILG